MVDAVGVYGYCVVPRDQAPAVELAGIADRPVTACSITEFAVWVSELDRPEPTVANIEAHNRVVEAAITETVTPVPLRFGQWSADFVTLSNAVVDKAGWYCERLSTFAGALEYGLHVICPAEAPSARDVHAPAHASGRDYMDFLRANAVAARERHENEARIRAAIAEELGKVVREEIAEQPRTPHGLVTLSHLVARAHFDEYRERTQKLRLQFPELRFLLSGPWAPYSFAG